MSRPATGPIRLRVETPAPPEPALLRPAIEAALAGLAWSGPERPVADAVARAVESDGEGAQPWR